MVRQRSYKANIAGSIPARATSSEKSMTSTLVTKDDHLDHLLYARIVKALEDKINTMSDGEALDIFLGAIAKSDFCAVNYEQEFLNFYISMLRKQFIEGK